jgi:uncharacterized membrane protein YozB (DUF420 family)
MGLAARAPVGANISLALVIVTTVMFTIGWRLAVRKRFTAHRWVQTVAVTINAAVVLAWMIRSLVLYVIPAIPRKLGQGPYAVDTAHAVVGAVGLVLGVSVVVRANELVPKGFRLTSFKGPMRAAYGVYLSGALTGVLLYLVAYAGGTK